MNRLRHSPLYAQPRWLMWAYRLSKMCSAPRRHIYITCFPKSGSTFLAHSLADITGYSYAYFVSNRKHNEQDLELSMLVKNLWRKTVTNHHTRATFDNLRLFNDSGIKPFVLVRNIFDCLVSMRDHLEHENEKWSMAYVAADYFQKTDKDKFDFLVHYFAPWYLGFYVSWQQATKHRLLDLMWGTYEDFVNDKYVFVQRLLDFYGIAPRVGKEAMLEILDRKNTDTTGRFNKGVIGRGEELLSSQQKDAVRRLAANYPATDFAMIGL